MLDVEFAQLSDTGRVREHNEDYLGSVIPATPAEARSHGWLFALADGVGGQERGEVASLTAIESMMSGFRGAPRGEPLPALLTRLVQAANAHVLDAGLTAARLQGIAGILCLSGFKFDLEPLAELHSNSILDPSQSDWQGFYAGNGANGCPTTDRRPAL